MLQDLVVLLASTITARTKDHSTEIREALAARHVSLNELCALAGHCVSRSSEVRCCMPTCDQKFGLSHGLRLSRPSTAVDDTSPNVRRRACVVSAACSAANRRIVGMVRWVVLVCMAACYSPAPATGVPCGAGSVCPAEQTCIAGVCSLDIPPMADAPLTSDASPPDATRIDGAVSLCAPPVTVPFMTPVLVTALNSSVGEGTPTVTGDLLEIYFKSNRAGGLGLHDIWMATRTSVTSSWSAPVPVVELNTTKSDESPEVAANGLTIWISSNRNVVAPATGDDLFVSTRADRLSKWTTPVLVAELNSSAHDDGMSVVPSSLVAYFHSRRAGTEAIYRTSRTSVTAPWSTPVIVSGIDSSLDEENPWISPDECTIYFGSNRVAGMAAFDIYVAARTDPTLSFDPPTLVTTLSTPQWDDDVWLTTDQRHIFMASNRGGQFDVFEASR